MNKFIGIELDDTHLYDFIMTPMYSENALMFYLNLKQQEVIKENTTVIIDNIFNVGNVYGRFVEIDDKGDIVPVMIASNDPLRIIANDLLRRNSDLTEFKTLNKQEKLLLLNGFSI